MSEIKEKDAAHSEKDAVINSMLEEKISEKHKEIETLEKELQKREYNLQSAQQEARKWQEELLNARAKLKEKVKEVKQLKEDSEKLSCSYNVRKKQVSKLIQLTVTLPWDKMAIKVCVYDCSNPEVHNKAFS